MENNFCNFNFINGEANVGMLIINQLMCVNVNKIVSDRVQFGKFQNGPP